MKNYTFIIIGFLFCANIYSQRYVYKKYLASTAEVNIEIQKTKTGYVVYIPADSYDPILKDGGLRITKEQLNGFRQNLIQAKQKYLEWIEVARTKNIKEIYKKIDINPNQIGAYFLYGDYLITDYSVYPQFYFQVYDLYGLFYVLTIKTGQLQYSKNQSVNCSGLQIESFKDRNDNLDFFINILHPDSISYFLKQPKIEDSFN